MVIKTNNGSGGGGHGGLAGMWRFGRPQPLLAPEGDAGGGGGALDQKVIDTINSAVTAQIKRVQFGPMIAEQLKQVTPDLTKTIAEQVTAAVAEQLKSAGGGTTTPPAGGQQQTPPAGGQQTPPAGGAIPPEMQNQLAQLTAQMKTLQESVAEKDRQLKAAAETNARKEEDELLRGALKAAGVADPLVDAAAAMFRQKGMIKRKDDGSIIVPVQRNQHGQTFTEELGIPAFVGEWTKSEEGKHYLPARRVGGGGPGGQGPNGGRVQQPGGQQQPPAGGHQFQQQPGNGPPRTADGKIDTHAWDQQLGNQLLALATGGVIEDVNG